MHAQHFLLSKALTFSADCTVWALELEFEHVYTVHVFSVMFCTKHESSCVKFNKQIFDTA